jgi:hypothetical protein
MRRALTVFLVAAGLSTLAASPAPGQDDGSIDLNKVPAAARQAAAKAAPGVKFTEASQDEEDGQKYFELTGKDPMGRIVDVDVTPAGKVLSIATQVRPRDVPKVVMDALRAKVKMFKITLVQQVVEDGKIVEYSFEGEDAQGEDLDVTVSADGSEVDVEKDDGN